MEEAKETARAGQPPGWIVARTRKMQEILETQDVSDEAVEPNAEAESTKTLACSTSKS